MGQGKLPFEYTVCIDSLIGEGLKAKGIKCPCPLHSPEGPGNFNEEVEKLQEEALLDRPPVPRRIPFDGIRDGEEKKQD
jgi:hypothetical protein